MAENPREWLRGGLLGVLDYDLAPDGQQMVALQAGYEGYAGQASSVTFLMNFGDELRRRTAPAK